MCRGQCKRMSYVSLKNLLGQAALAAPDKFDEWQKSWRVAVESGSQESLFEFISRESGISDEVFLQKARRRARLAFLDLRHVTIPTEARNKISTKVAFQYSVLPTDYQDSTLQVAVSNPVRSRHADSVQFDARHARAIRARPKAEIEKALKKYYGVGAETLDELAKDEPLELLVGEDKEITEGDQEASVIKFVNQIVWEAFKDRATDIHFEPAEDELRIRSALTASCTRRRCRRS